MKLRMKFEKGDSVKYLSHLDIVRVFERAFRRAGLPISYTLGFNPRPKMSFTPALSVGITSSSEYVDVEFTEDVTIKDLVDVLNDALPVGLKITKADETREKIKLSALNTAVYTVGISLNKVDVGKLLNSVDTLLSKKEIIIEKRTKAGIKSVDIAPLIYKIHIATIDEHTANIIMETSIGQQGNVAPMTIVSQIEEVLKKELVVLYMDRKEIFYSQDNNRILPI